MWQDARSRNAAPDRITLCTDASANHRRTAVAIADLWRSALGLETAIVELEWNVYLDTRRHPGDCDLMRLGWSADFVDAEAFADVFESGHPQNTLGYRSRQYDELLRKSRMAADASTRAALLADAEAQLLADAPVVPIFFRVSKRLVKPHVDGYHASPLGHVATRDLRIRPHSRDGKKGREARATRPSRTERSGVRISSRIGSLDRVGDRLHLGCRERAQEAMPPRLASIARWMPSAVRLETGIWRIALIGPWQPEHRELNSAAPSMAAGGGVTGGRCHRRRCHRRRRDGRRCDRGRHRRRCRYRRRGRTAFLAIDFDPARGKRAAVPAPRASTISPLARAKNVAERCRGRRPRTRVAGVVSMPTPTILNRGDCSASALPLISPRSSGSSRSRRVAITRPLPAGSA